MDEYGTRSRGQGFLLMVAAFIALKGRVHPVLNGIHGVGLAVLGYPPMLREHL